MVHLCSIYPRSPNRTRIAPTPSMSDSPPAGRHRWRVEHSLLVLHSTSEGSTRAQSVESESLDRQSTKNHLTCDNATFGIRDFRTGEEPA